MTLAAILFVSVLYAASPMPTSKTMGQSALQTPPSSVAVQSQPVPEAQNPPPSSQPAATAPATTQAPSAPGRPSAKPSTRKKKRTISPNCGSAAPKTSATSPSVPGTSAGVGTTSGNSPTLEAVSPSTNCPPPRIIVRQGGTAESNIQLAGGPAGEQASQQRDTANRLLGTTEQNLQKVSGRELTANQQDMIKQIRQFMEQSKNAVAAGDLDRARTLAWKAQLLSEELVKPQK